MSVTRTDDELGPMRYCVRCDEWWPLDAEFWYIEMRQPRPPTRPFREAREPRPARQVLHCRACRFASEASRENRRIAQEQEARYAAEGVPG